jgi:hypothetical protein
MPVVDVLEVDTVVDMAGINTGLSAMERAIAASVTRAQQNFQRLNQYITTMGQQVNQTLGQAGGGGANSQTQAMVRAQQTLATALVATTTAVSAQTTAVGALTTAFNTALTATNNSGAAHRRNVQNIQQHTQATTNLGTSQRQLSANLNNLSFQFSDIFTQLSGGTGIMQVMMQQGPQILQVIQTTNGGVSTLARGIAGLVTPLRAAVLVGGSLAAVALYAAANWDSVRSKMQLATLGAGRVGLSAEQALALADRSAARNNLSLGESRSVVQAGLGQGLGQTALAGLQTGARDLSAIMGTSVDQAATQTASALRNPTQAYQELGRQFGFATVEGERFVRTMSESGRQVEAQTFVINEMNRAIQGSFESLTGWERLWIRIRATASGVLQPVGEFIDRATGGGTLDQRRQDLEGRLRQAREGQANQQTIESLQRFSDIPIQPAQNFLQTIIDTKLELAQVNTQMRNVSQNTDAAARAAANYRTQAAFNRALPEVGQREQRQSDAAILQQSENNTRQIERVRDQQERFNSALDQDNNLRAAMVARLNGQGVNINGRTERANGEGGMFSADQATQAQRDADARFEAQRRRDQQERQQAAVNAAGARDTLLTPQQQRTQQHEIEMAQIRARSPEQLGEIARRQAILALNGQYISQQEQLQEGERAYARAVEQARFQLSEAARERLLSADQQNRAAREDINLVGQSTGMIEGQRYLRQQTDTIEAEAARNRTTVNENELRLIRERARAYGELRDQLAQVKLQSDITFERSQLGRTDSEQRIYERLRSTFGDANINGPAAQAAANQLRWNDALKEGKDAASDFLSTWISGMRQGQSAAEAFAAGLNRIADRLLRLATDQAISSIFKAFTGAGNPLGFLGSLFGGGSGGAATGSPTSLWSGSPWFTGVGNTGGTGVGSVAGFGGASFPSFMGNVFTPHALGGIVRAPGIFPMANGGIGSIAEREPEAVMPLRRTAGGRLGVEVANGGGRGVNVVIHESPGRPQVSQDRDGTINIDYRQVIAAEVADPNSPTSQALASVHGTQPTTRLAR